MNPVLYSPAAELGSLSCAGVNSCTDPPVASVLYKVGPAPGAVLSEHVRAQGAWRRDRLFSSSEPASQASSL